MLDDDDAAAGGGGGITSIRAMKSPTKAVAAATAALNNLRE